MSEFDQKYNIVDETTPLNAPLTAHYKKSFAFYTIKERLPVIITQIIDQLSREKDLLANEYGGEAVKDVIKEIQGSISKLKYELQTDKPFTQFNDNVPDKEDWNTFLSNLNTTESSYFTGVWLVAECYMYRRLKSIFVQSDVLSDYDYFRKQKINAFTVSHESMISVVKHTNSVQECIKTEAELQELLIKLMKLNLWGNRCDLSISIGREIKQTGNPFEALESFEPCLLVDKSESIWNCLKNANETATIDFVQDNSGYELFVDLLLAKIIIENKLAKRIRFHIKAIPWFISDVTPYDFTWTLQMLANHENAILVAFGQKLNDFMASGQFELCPVEYFWTGPYEYHTMNTVNKELYDKLSEAHLIIFKGDLNYRKLLGDFHWPFNSTFEETLRGFRPTNLCALRTVKADIICELKDGIAENLSKNDPMWMETGQYGVIHFAPKIQ